MVIIVKSKKQWLYTNSFSSNLAFAFRKSGIPIKIISPQVWLKKRNFNEFGNSSIYLFEDTLSLDLKQLQNIPGRKYGFCFKSNFFAYDSQSLNIKETEELKILRRFTKVFANSRQSYLKLNPIVNNTALLGTFVDRKLWKCASNLKQTAKTVVFPLDFSPASNRLLAIELSRRLVKKGFKVIFLLKEPQFKLAQKNPEGNAMLNLASNNGILVKICNTPGAYYLTLATTELVVSTSVADTLEIPFLEAVCLGAIPVAPSYGGFPDFLHTDNLYSPFNIKEAEEIILKRPIRKHNILRFKLKYFFLQLLKEMGFIKYKPTPV